MTAIRLSPSGPIIGNTTDGKLEFGPGARLRLNEIESTVVAAGGGTLAVPTSQAVICSDGFSGASELGRSLVAPKAGLRYRADLRLDLFNITSSQNCVVCLFLETSVDEGVTWTTRAKNAHVLQPQLGVGAEDNGQARECSLTMVQALGSTLGVVDGTTTSIRFRAAAQLSTGSFGNVLASSDASDGTVTGLNGTVYLAAEECF